MAVQVTEDVVCPQGILWKHRQDGDTDIYFLSNQTAQERTETISFRANNRVPELWWPETGRIEDAPAYEMAKGRTSVPVHFDPQTSVFVVFRHQGPAKRVAESKGDGKLEAPAGSEISGPWDVDFGSQHAVFDKLISWTEHADSGIKYFSGAATYSRKFEIPDSKSQMILDLGRVEALATVTVNGHSFATLWKPPYRLDISSALKAGENTLAVTVVNAWHNRLVGDAGLPMEKRQTRLTAVAAKARDRLQPAGLLGPVQLWRKSPP